MRQEVGQRGEDAAAIHLVSKGYEVVARNYHSRFGEVDIIAKNEKYLVFVEVKARAKGTEVQPKESVNALKQRRLVKTAMIYLSERGADLQPRFDVIEVWVERKIGTILALNHIENAFWGVDFYEAF